jgi:hypothetical protein
MFQGAYGYEDADASRFRGMNPEFVRKVWAKRRAAMPVVEREPRFWTAERLDQVATMLKDGASYRQIARMFNRSDKTIVRLIWEHPQLSAARAERAPKPKSVEGIKDWTLAAPTWVCEELVAVAKAHGVTTNEIIDDIRVKRVCAARNELFYRLRMNEREPSWGQLGRWFGREHTATMYAASVHAEKYGLPLKGGVSVVRKKARSLERRLANA